MIYLKNLTKIYNLYKTPNDRLKEALSLTKKIYHEEFYALKNLNFNIGNGEIVGIIGNNGSGKSTLLKLITGVLTPTSGSITLNGKITALLELGAGFNPELTGIENIYLHGSLSGYTKEQMQNKLDEIISFAEIGVFINQATKTYSSGMKARLAFSLSINVNPEIFIIDEVLSVGDAAFQRKCFAKIESFKEQGKTILFVSHSSAQVVQLCHRVVWLHRGEKVIEGKSKTVVALYQKYGSKTELDFQKVRDEFEEKLFLKKGKSVTKKLVPLINEKLKPSSTVVYEENGAKIYDVKLLNLDKQETNVLEKNYEYYYSYKVVFNKNYNEVNLAMLIKTTSGFEIGGKEIALIKEQKLTDIEPKKEYHIKWKFKNILNRGTYFFNCGVNTMINEEKVVLHRILDAYMFEVLSNFNDKANNIIDFGFELSVEE